jgi:hypothetical protein
MTRGAVALIVAIALAACAPILGIRPRQSKPFEHRAHTEKGVNCRECHGGVETAGDTGPLHMPETTDCVRCHTKPHDERACSGCHGQPSTRASAAFAREQLAFAHRTHVTRLRGECVRCHEGVVTDADRIRPSMAVCLGCHEHKEQFATRACETCHVDLPGEHVLPASHMAHEADFLHSHGAQASSSRDLCATCHAERFCAGCHGVTVPVLPERFFFDDPLRTGIHRAGFFARHSNEARSQPGLCNTCHTPSSCEGCHAKRNVHAASGAARSPHPAGWLGTRGQRNDHGRAAWRDPLDCASCHSGAGEALCIGCHRVGGQGGNPHRPGWTSRLNKVTDMPCRVCHGVGP